MAKSIETKNRRKFPRFKVDSDLFVLHSCFGKVVEIGMGGFVYTYVEKDNSNHDAKKHGIFFNGKDNYHAELPLKTISDAALYESSSSRLTIRKRVVVFDDLESQQIEELEKLIIDNVPTIHNYKQL